MSRKTLHWLVILTLALSACTAQEAATPTGNPAAPTAEDPTGSTPTAKPGACVNSAAFVSDVTVPDNANFDKSEEFVKTWRVKNTGTCAWTNKYTLVFADGEQMGAPASTPLKDTAPGKTLDISVTMTAPDKDAAYRADFELHDASGKAMPVDNGTTVWVVITVGTASASTASTPASASCALTAAPANAAALIDAVNAYRVDNGLPALTVNAVLSSAAQTHSNDMACNNLFVHTGSDGSTAQSRAATAGYSGTVTENVYGRNPAPSAQETVAWWATDQTDPRHNLNLLSTKYTEIGAGYSFFNDFGYYAVVFGAP
ncbi:MAG: hypothetical protein IT314_02735 [Anaerolineales bacterium]|nr:hypothetical protein [Anaerolineales bacterium]